MVKHTFLFAVVTGFLVAASGQCAVVYSPGPLPPPPPFLFGAPQPVDFDGDGIGEVEFTLGLTLCTMDVPTSFCSTPFFIGANTNELLISGY